MTDNETLVKQYETACSNSQRGEAARFRVTQDQLDDAMFSLDDYALRRLDGEFPPSPPLPPPFDVDAAWEALPLWRKWIWRVANRVRSWAFYEPDADEEDEW